jgi:hypothetical protein
MVVSAETIGGVRERMSALAESGRGEYDGWEASPQP